jgi:hypothetical protein
VGVELLFALLLVVLLETDGSPAKADRGVSLDLPLPSESEFWLVEEGAGEVISIGSPGAGGDILMVGVGIGMTRAPIDWWWVEGEVEVNGERVSVLTAMCAVAMVVSRGEGQGKTVSVDGIVGGSKDGDVRNGGWDGGYGRRRGCNGGAEDASLRWLMRESDGRGKAKRIVI